jgi:hypothetical protein
MTHIETARFNEVIGLQIGAIRETVHKLNENCDLEELESIVAELEGMTADLKRSLAAVPHKHQ